MPHPINVPPPPTHPQNKKNVSWYEQDKFPSDLWNNGGDSPHPLPMEVSAPEKPMQLNDSTLPRKVFFILMISLPSFKKIVTKLHHLMNGQAPLSTGLHILFRKKLKILQKYVIPLIDFV